MGWDQGCLGMKVGEKRLLVIPAEEGYGEAGKIQKGSLYFFNKEVEHAQRLTRLDAMAPGFPLWGIPPGGTLQFTLECLKIMK